MRKLFLTVLLLMATVPLYGQSRAPGIVQFDVPTGTWHFVTTNGTLDTAASGGLTFQNGGSGIGVASIFNCGTNTTCSNSGGVLTITASATAATAFSALTSATNTQAAMLVGTGASLGPTGTGTVTANALAAGSLTSSQVAAAVTDENGTGTLVFGTSPTLVAPALGTPSALVLTNATGLPCGALPTLTGDITTPGSSCVTTLATVNANVGSFTNANITVDAKGRITAAATGSGAGVTSIATTSPITGGTITTTGTIACATCVTSAAALTNNAVVLGGGLQASATGVPAKGVLLATTVYTDQTNVYTAGLQDFTSATMEVPEGVGFAANVNSTLGLDTTANNIHVWANAADAIVAPFASAPTTGHCIQATVSSGNVLLSDSGSTNCGGGGATALSAITVATGANTIANGNNPQTWNWAQTTDAQDGIAFGETSAATNGTLTNGLANQAVHSISTATNSTATPLEIAQGSITNTVATPLLQLESTWNNSGLTGEGILENVTNTSSAAASVLMDLRVGNSTQFKVDVSGNATGASYTATGSGAGYFQCSAGTAPTLVAANIQISCPASGITNYQFILPAVSATGYLLGTNAANVNTLSFVNAIPIGNVGSSGLSGTLPISISAAGAISTNPTAHNESTPLTCLAASGSGTTYTCTTSPSFTPADGDVILFQADVASTGAMTLNVNSTSAAPVKKQGGGTAIAANDFLAGQDTLLEFDGANWQMQGQTGNGASGAVTSVSGDGTVITNSASTGAVTLTIAGTSGGIPYFNTATSWASSAALTHYGVVYGGGAGGAPVSTAADTTTTHALFATATAPAFRAIATGDLPNIPLNQVVSPTGAIATFADGNNPLIFNCALTSGTTCLTTGETTAATTAGAVEHQITTLTTSTSIALQLTQGANGPANAAAPNIINVTAAAAGGLAGASNAGSIGAGYVLLGGNGSAGGATTGNGGAGGSWTITEGNGGAGGGTTTNNGGNGGGHFGITGNGGNAGATGTSGNGGNFSVTLGVGGTTGTPGVNGQFLITSTAPASVAGTAGIATGTLFNVVGIAGGASSNAAGTGGVGSVVSLNSGTGGAGTGTNAVGGAGGALNLTTGNGGASLGTGANANGGNVVFTLGKAGIGGSGTAGVTGEMLVQGTAIASSATSPGLSAGTLFSITGLTGGGNSTATGTAGVGSLLSLVAGNGGAATGATAGTGGAGGTVTLTTGTGGGASGNAPGGAGGALNLTAGPGGAGAGTGTNANGGSIVLTPGAAGTGGSGTAGLAGVVQVAGANAGFVYLAQGATNTTANTNIPANSIIDQAPTAVTAYTITRPGAAPNIASYKQTDGCASAICTESYHPVPVLLTVASDFTDSTSTTLQLITGLSTTLPVSKAVVISFHCGIIYDQGTSAVSDSFGIGITGTAPTQANASGTAFTSTSVLVTGTLTALASTTPTAVVTFTPSAITTIWKAELDGTVEQPSNATPGVFGVYVATTTGTDNFIVKRGSYCSVWYQ
jgi:hypothetical protein